MRKILLFLAIVLVTMNCFAADRVFEGDAKNILNNLINFYSKKDADNLIALVDLDFSDSRGYSCADLAAALKNDFRSFSNINLYITGVREQIISDDNSKITLVVEWNRAMSVSSNAQIWMLRGTTSLTFIKDSNSKIKLKEITGDLFIGLANFDGVITLSSGTLDGTQITVPILVKEGRFI